MGEGGRQSDLDEKRASHGAGVVGFGGAISPREIGFNGPLRAAKKLVSIDAGGAGVFGLGAEQTTHQFGTPNARGPINPGPGVVGVGGQEQNTLERSAAGVVGFSGFRPDPFHPQLKNLPYSLTNNAGVFGMSKSGRGGVFASEGKAQLQLMPHKTDVDLSSTIAVSPSEVTSEGNDFKLPRDGQPGDFFAMSDSSGRCILWFCVNGPGQTGASWAQVLLGTKVTGEA